MNNRVGPTLYVVVRVTPARTVCSSTPGTRRHAKADLDKLRKARPGFDLRIARLTVPQVAPFSDFWPVSA